MRKRRQKKPGVCKPTPCGWMAHELELLKEQFPRITQGETYEYFRIFGNDLDFTVKKLMPVVRQLEETSKITSKREESYRLLARIVVMSRWLNELARIAAGRKKLEVPSVTELVKSDWVEKRNRKNKK